MVTKRVFLLIAIIIAVAFPGCQKADVPGGKDESNRNIDALREQGNNMTLDEKIGQMVMAGVDSYTNNEHSQTLISKYHVGGFVILGQNVKDTEQVLRLINSLRETNTGSKNKIPLFMGVDQEGGRVSRMPAEFVKFPANKAIGAVNSSEFSYKIGSLLGQEVRAFGYNIDFAPVLDINSNPKNPVIGDRSFGSEPAIVKKLGIETMKGIRSQNIIPVVKHFPGHGDTSVDSHTGLPVLDFDLKRLREFELVPFAEAVKNDADMIMVAHILFPKIDSEYPASMSESIIGGLLKKELRFKGIVVTDDMTMGAIVKNFDIGAAAVRSVKSGADIVMVCHDFDKEKAVLEALQSAAEKGEISKERIDESVYKLLQLKQKYHIKDKKIDSLDVKGLNSQVKTMLERYIKK